MTAPREKRRTGLFGWIFRLLFLYLLLVFGGGTLIHTDHPVAVELGRLMHTVTLVEPSIWWAEANGHDGLATTLETLAGGVDVGGLWS